MARPRARNQRRDQVASAADQTPASDRQHYTDPSASRHTKRHLRTPSEELSRIGKLRREALHRRFLSGALVLILVVGAFAAALDLSSWPAWVVLGAICVTVIGVIIATSPTRRA